MGCFIMYVRLRQLREDKDLTQKDLSILLNMSRTGYNQYELGKNDIPTDILIKLSYIYNTSIDYILGVTDVIIPYKRRK